MDYKIFFDKINLQKEGRDLFWKINERLCDSAFKSRIYEGFEKFKLGNESFERFLMSFSSEQNILPEQMHLYLTILYAENAKNKMETLGISDEYFFGCFHGVGTNCEKTLKKTGVVGLEMFELPWFRYSINAELFLLGRLEFQLARSEYDVDFGDYKVKKGDTVLFVHIPGSAPLTEEACKDSYLKAIDFFGTYYGMKNLPCFCYTWILQPWIADVVSSSSNIIKFKNSFRLLETVQSIPHTFRFIFDDQYDNIDDYPTDKPLRKAAVERRKNNEFIGYGVGVRLINKETFKS